MTQRPFDGAQDRLGAVEEEVMTYSYIRRLNQEQRKSLRVTEEDKTGCRIYSVGLDNQDVPLWECSYHHQVFSSPETPEKCPRGLEVPTQGWRLALLEKRQAVLAKTGGKCSYCGTDLNIDTLHSDHAQSSFNGGKDHIDNLLPACSTCNVRKNHRNLEDFREWLKLRLLKRTQDLIEQLKASEVYFDEGVSAEAVSHVQEIERLIANTAVTFYIDSAR